MPEYTDGIFFFFFGGGTGVVFWVTPGSAWGLLLAQCSRPPLAVLGDHVVLEIEPGAPACKHACQPLARSPWPEEAFCVLLARLVVLAADSRLLGDHSCWSCWRLDLALATCKASPVPAAPSLALTHGVCLLHMEWKQVGRQPPGLTPRFSPTVTAAGQGVPWARADGNREIELNLVWRSCRGGEPSG